MTGGHVEKGPGEWEVTVDLPSTAPAECHEMREGPSCQVLSKMQNQEQIIGCNLS